MKRTFVIAVLTGSLAMPAALFAANPAGPNGPNNAAPQQQLGGMNNPAAQQQAIGGMNNAAGNPGQNVSNPGQNLGNPAQNLANPAQNPGQNPALAGGGAPVNGMQNANGAGDNQAIIGNMKEMHGRLDGQSIGVAAPAVAEGAAVAVKTEVKAPEHAPEAANFLFNFCRFREMRRMVPPGFPVPPMQMMPMQGPAAPVGDLVLVNVGMVEDATPAHGPIYRLTMLNDSPMPAFHFHVSMIAVLGDIGDSSIVVTRPIRFIAPKATASIDIMLPAGVMSLGTPAAPFEKLIAVVDSLDELAETNELNNVVILTRSEVVTVVTKTEAAAAPVAGGAVAGGAAAQVSTTVQSSQTVATPAPAAGGAVVNGAATVAAPVNGAAPAGPPAGGAAAAVAPANGGPPAGPPAPANGGAAAGPQAGPDKGPAVATPADKGEAALPDLDKVDGASQLLDG